MMLEGVAVLLLLAVALAWIRWRPPPLTRLRPYDCAVLVTGAGRGIGDLFQLCVPLRRPPSRTPRNATVMRRLCDGHATATLW